ncbi:hypothetical protein [Deinococcus altitudinis]|uniref:hypothetical protein n=1 Tax=Deinococcus altitudinis TaxID=468914 RepID=UPI0038926DA5
MDEPINRRRFLARVASFAKQQRDNDDALEGQRIAAPQEGFALPDPANLRYHAEEIHRG